MSAAAGTSGTVALFAAGALATPPQEQARTPSLALPRFAGLGLPYQCQVEPLRRVTCRSSWSSHKEPLVKAHA